MSNNEETMSYQEAMAALFDGCLTAFARFGAMQMIKHTEEERLRHEIKVLKCENELLRKGIKA